MLAKFIGDLTAPIYYVAGPPGTAEGLVDVLSDAGVPNEDIRAEAFTGY